MMSLFSFRFAYYYIFFDVFSSAIWLITFCILSDLGLCSLMSPGGSVKLWNRITSCVKYAVSHQTPVEDVQAIKTAVCGALRRTWSISSREFQHWEPPCGNIMCDFRGLTRAGRLRSVSSRVIYMWHSVTHLLLCILKLSSRFSLFFFWGNDYTVWISG